MPMLEKIQGSSKESDRTYVSKIDLSDLEVSRINSVDKAFEYIERNAHEKATAFTPAMMVACFGIGAGLIASLWLMTTYLPMN